MFFIPVILVFSGLVMLYFGGIFLVNGATSIAEKLHIAPMVVGLTVVAFWYLGS